MADLFSYANQVSVEDYVANIQKFEWDSQDSKNLRRSVEGRFYGSTDQGVRAVSCYLEEQEIDLSNYEDKASRYLKKLDLHHRLAKTSEGVTYETKFRLLVQLRDELKSNSYKYFDTIEEVDQNERKQYFLNPIRLKEHFVYFGAAAEKANIRAASRLGSSFRDGFTPNGMINYQEAFNATKHAADKGHVEAMLNLALLYICGMTADGRHHYVEGVALLEKAHALGEMNATYNLGVCYRDGKTPNGKKNLTLALQYFEEAGEKGHKTAYVNIGDCHRLGITANQKINYLTAMDYYEKASTLGSLDAVHRIGLCYMAGEYGHEKYKSEQNITKAFEFFTSAANAGHRDSAATLGKRYFEGRTPDRQVNYWEAVKYLTIAADQMHGESAHLLTSYYYYPKYGAKNDQLAGKYATIVRKTGFMHKKSTCGIM